MRNINFILIIISSFYFYISFSSSSSSSLSSSTSTSFLSSIPSSSSCSSSCSSSSNSNSCSSSSSSCSKKQTIAIFGGSGKLGSECIYQGLNLRNLNIITLVRDQNKLIIPQGTGGELKGNKLIHSNLKVIEGIIQDENKVNKVFENNDITGVIIALGGRSKDVGPTMLTDGTKNIINSMKKFGVKRVSVVTSIGIGDSEKKAPWSFRLLMATVMRKTKADKNNQEQLFTSPDGPGHDLEYTIFRPGGLGFGPPTGVIYANLDKDGGGGEGGSVHRSDLASFLLDSVDIFSPKPFPYLRKTPGISSTLGTGWKKEKGGDFDAPTENQT